MIRTSKSPKQRYSYRNTYGEELRLTVDLERETAVLSSEDFDTVRIAGDRFLDTDLILGEDESDWVVSVWRAVFDRKLEKLSFNRAMEELIRQYQEEPGDDREHSGPH